MNNIVQTVCKKEIIFYLFIGISFLYGVLSYQHYAPSPHDFYIHSIVFTLCSIGVFFSFFKQNIKIYLNQFLWVLLFLIFLIQPILYHINYIEGLTFPLASSLLLLFLSIAASNVINKEKLTLVMCLILGLAAILLFVTQLFHVFQLDFIVKAFNMPLQRSRFSGNLGQPNQTAFVFVLGVISIMYFLRDKYSLLKYSLIFLLSIGIALTVSRGGFLMLFLGVLIFNLYLNYFNKISLFRLTSFFTASIGLLCGTLIYPYLSQSFTIVERSATLLGSKRLSHLQQTWLIISEHPFMGIGWKNFTGSGLEYSNQLAWFGTTDHSHFIFGQLWSEFGIFGLALIGLFFYIIFKNIKISNIKQAYISIILAIILMYSCFEFPLWQFRYLMIFLFF